MIRVPNKKEVKDIVMWLNRKSTRGSDDITGVFYQDTWEIVGEDIYQMVNVFFCGFELLGFITHTKLVMLPTKLIVNAFFDFRRISLSNFVNKIFSRIIHDKIKSLLPEIILEE